MVELEDALQRLRRIDWGACEEKPSNVELVKEYLRRSAKWSDALGREEQRLIFNIAYAIMPLPESVIAEIDDLVGEIGFPKPIISRLCSYYLQWELVNDSANLTRFALPSPYEPLILAFERGGWLMVEQGILFVNGVIPLVLEVQRYDRQEPFIELDKQALDEFDKSHVYPNENDE